MTKYKITSVTWSPRASNDLKHIVDTIAQRWSKKDALLFIGKLEKSISSITTLPKGFPLSKDKKGLRKCVISKQTTLYYRHKSRQLEIIALFDTRQNPIKAPK